MLLFHSTTKFLRSRPRTLLAFVALFFVLNAFGQTPPPNDYYSNSITLTGTDITFSGTLAGATIEDSQETVAPGQLLEFSPTQSVWWNWTAPEDTALTLEIVSTSFEFYSPQSYPYAAYSDGLFVYNATNGSLSPAGVILPALGANQTIPILSPQTVSIPVTGGSNYQIQLIGNSSANYTIRLVATNTPLILTQPRSQTVSSNASALFYVVYAGVGQPISDYRVPQTNFTFQWYFNGTNLPGETAPMLALTNIDSSIAGVYTVTVSNSAGATLSAPATLTVNQLNFPTLLRTVGITITNGVSLYGSYLYNAFWMNFNGAIGQSYRLQSSADLTNWAPLTIFPMDPVNPGTLTSVFNQTDPTQVFSTPVNAQRQFFRVRPYVTSDAHAEICVNNLRQIRIAKMLWQRDYNYYVTATPFASDIVHYLPHQTLPFCPDDYSQSFATSYVIDNLQTPPVCQINSSNHVLIDPR